MSAARPLARKATQHDPLERFLQLFRELRHDTLHRLDEVYDERILFEDPLHRIEGRDALRAYFDRMYAGVESIDFEYGELMRDPGQAMVTWSMQLRHRRFRPGELLTLPGASHLRFTDRVHYHRDYFDAGALIYERLPLVGGVVRAIRRRV
jgi:hypothetical protein